MSQELHESMSITASFMQKIIKKQGYCELYAQ